MNITAIRGFNDILPGDSDVFRLIESEAWRVFSSYGYSEIRLPVVEKTELFSRSIGETTDIVEKEMYTFPDRHGDSLTLRPEGTASAVRAYIEHKLYTLPVAKLYYTGPMFRYERPQKGRYRQFYQIGAECLGDSSPRSDAEALSMLMAFFERLDLRGAALQINSLGCADCRPAYKERLKTFLAGRVDTLCENCRRRVGANPLRALDCKGHGCIEAAKDAPSIIDALCRPCSTHFEAVRAHLRLSGVEALINARMVRGLDYYTRTTFEITAEGLGSQNAVAAGGRYDRLVAELGGPETPCFGFAVGMERLALIIREGVQKRPLGVFIALDPQAEEKGAALLKDWRGRGLKLIEDFSAGQLKNRMKRADRLGARYVVILGPDEFGQGCVTFKDMASALQEKIPWDGVPGRVLKGATGAVES